MDDYQNIMLELVKENTQLRKLLFDKSESVGSKIYILSENPLRIRGILIAEGIWKGVYYDYAELTKALDKFDNLKGMVMHGHSEKYKDRVIGKLEKVIKDDLLRAIKFEAIVTDEDAIKDIRDGKFDAVSIKVEFENVDFTKTPPYGKGLKPIEWSLTSTPACDTCLIFNAEELDKHINTLNMNITQSNNSVVMMNDQNTPELAKPKCPACGKEFEDLVKFDEHWMNEEHNKLVKDGEKYGEEKEKQDEKYGEYKEEEKEMTKPKDKDKDEEKYEEYYYENAKKIICPVCGKEFDNKKDFNEHWDKEEKDKYGEYKPVSKLIKKVLKDRELINKIRKVLELSELSNDTKTEVKPETIQPPVQPVTQPTTATVVEQPQQTPTPTSTLPPPQSPPQAPQPVTVDQQPRQPEVQKPIEQPKLQIVTVDTKTEDKVVVQEKPKKLRADDLIKIAKEEGIDLLTLSAMLIVESTRKDEEE